MASGADEPSRSTGAPEDAVEMISRNRGAYRNYFVHDRYEAGVKLVKSEVAGLRERRVELGDAYGTFEEGELFLVDARIGKPHDWDEGARHEAERPRKLLLRRRQLNRMESRVERAGFTVIPLALYFRDDHVKAHIGICEGKKQFHKQREVEQRRRAQERADEHGRHRDHLEWVYEKHT